MFVLKKLFQLREHGNPEAEKPFLDHLDDLRITITRIILTLLVSTVICYVFRNTLMEVIRHPVEKVWNQSQSTALAELKPRPSIETWEAALEAAGSIAGLTEAQRDHFINSLGIDDKDFAFHVESAFHYRAALPITDKVQRAEYFKTLPDIPEELRKQLLALNEGDPNARLEAKGRMVVMQSLNPTEGFMLSIKLAFFAGIVISFPLLLYYLLQFILPGLHEHEQKALFPALGIGFLLFLTGVLFAYFIILPNVLNFFYEYNGELGVQNDWRIGYYISFATQFVLIFGLAFELPVVVMTLVKIGILSHDMMKGTRSYAILAIFIIAAIITPTPDAFTLCLLAVPMYVLYEICIWLSYFHDKKEKTRMEAEERERLERLLDGPTPAPASGAQPRGSEDDEDEFDGPDPALEDLHSQAPEDEFFENQEEERQ
ncbi:MAG: twin-arginine translocase subunit TatC [Verrucomicrobiota bacterium JB023]|nr:twin-arginine translocase subunit TatC [Verrucomicrobiota bacterium JB023]